MRIVTKNVFIIVSIITIFWGVMTYLLILREYFPEQYTLKADYKHALAEIKEKRQSQMTIYYGHGPRLEIGKARSVITPNLDGTFTIETDCKLSLSIRSFSMWKQISSIFNLPGKEGKSFDSNLNTIAEIGPDYQLKEISFNFQSSMMTLSGSGKVKSGKLLLDMVQNGQKLTHEVVLPPGAVLNESIGMFKQFSKLQVGKRLQIQWFDPVTQTSRSAVAEVKGKMNYAWFGKKIPVYVIWTTSGPMKTTTLVDEQGDIFQYEVFSFVFIKDPEKNEKIKNE